MHVSRDTLEIGAMIQFDYSIEFSQGVSGYRRLGNRFAIIQCHLTQHEALNRVHMSFSDERIMKVGSKRDVLGLTRTGMKQI